MSNDFRTNPLLVEIFGGDSDNQFTVSPELSVDGLDATIREIDDKPQPSWAGNDLIQQIVQDDLFRAFGVEPTLPPTPIGPKPGHIPSTPTPIRPVKIPKSRHRKTVETLLSNNIPVPRNRDARAAWNRVAASIEDFVVDSIRGVA